MNYLIARDIQTAIIVAEKQEGWSRTSPRTFSTKEGKTVRIVANLSDLMGRRGFTIYIGYGFASRPVDEYLAYMRMFKNRQAELVYIAS